MFEFSASSPEPLKIALEPDLSLLPIKLESLSYLKAAPSLYVNYENEAHCLNHN